MDVSTHGDRVRPAGQGAHPSVGVVVCCWTPDRLDQVAAAVRSARSQRRAPDELLVVVDGDEALADRFRTVLPGERVVALGERHGVARARNHGAALVSTDLLFFLDDDAVAAPGWIEALAPALDDPHVLGVSARSVPEHEGQAPEWFPEEYLWTVGCSFRGMPTQAAPVRNFFGGCAGVRRADFLALGGFTEGLGHGPASVGGGEEADYCLRARAAHPGGTFWYVPEAVVHHRVPAERARLGYLVRRCWDEGVMKGALARSSTTEPGALGPERAFALRLPLAVLRHAASGRWGAAGATVVASLAVVAGLVRGRLRGLPAPAPDAPRVPHPRSPGGSDA